MVFSHLFFVVTVVKVGTSNLYTAKAWRANVYKKYVNTVLIMKPDWRVCLNVLATNVSQDLVLPFSYRLLKLVESMPADFVQWSHFVLCVKYLRIVSLVIDPYCVFEQPKGNMPLSSMLMDLWHPTQTRRKRHSWPRVNYVLLHTRDN